MLGDSLRRRQSGGTMTPKTKRARTKPVRWRKVIPATLAALIIPFAVGDAAAVYVLFPPPEASGTGIPVPSLAGSTVAEANQLLAAAGLGSADTTMLPHPDAPARQALAQDPLPGQHLRPGTDVGQPYVIVPDVEGFGAESAEQILRRLGFATNRVEERSFTVAGRVVRLQPAPGSRHQLPATVTLVVSAGYWVQSDTLTVQPDSISW